MKWQQAIGSVQPFLRPPAIQCRQKLRLAGLHIAAQGTCLLQDQRVSGESKQDIEAANIATARRTLEQKRIARRKCLIELP